MYKIQHTALATKQNKAIFLTGTFSESCFAAGGLPERNSHSQVLTSLVAV